MSFGFSVGDIVLLSQLAYKLYSNVTSGRRGASRDLKELEDVLFGLHCALDHLGKVASSISVSASNQAMFSTDTHEKLNLMIASCSSALQELDSMTQKYRDGVMSAESAAVEEAEITPGKHIKIRAAQLKRNLERNFTKVRWDMKRQSFQEYRDKLQAHVDTINIVLNTLLLSATHRIESDSKIDSTHIKGLLKESLENNQSLLKLAEDIHNLLLDSQHPLPKQGEPPGPLVYAHCAVTTHMPLGSQYHKMSQPFPPDFLQNHVSPSFDIPEPVQRLPNAIVELNRQRQFTGAKEFELRKSQLSTQLPVVKPSFLIPELPTVGQLHDGLTYVFRPSVQIPARQPLPDLAKREYEIVWWIQGLHHFVNSSVSTSISSTLQRNSENSDQGNSVVDLLVHLNESIEKSDEAIKVIFYRALRHTQMDDALDKLQKISKSVRAMKEIEEFRDVKEEWRDKNSVA